VKHLDRRSRGVTDPPGSACYHRPLSHGGPCVPFGPRRCRL